MDSPGKKRENLSGSEERHGMGPCAGENVSPRILIIATLLTVCLTKLGMISGRGERDTSNMAIMTRQVSLLKAMDGVHGGKEGRS